MNAPTQPTTEQTSRARRLAWFVGLWTAGVAATGLVSLGIRYWLT